MIFFNQNDHIFNIKKASGYDGGFYIRCKKCSTSFFVHNVSEKQAQKLSSNSSFTNNEFLYFESFDNLEIKMINTLSSKYEQIETCPYTSADMLAKSIIE